MRRRIRRPGADRVAGERSISDRQHRRPKSRDLTGTPSGGKIEVRFHAKDALSVIDKAEYSVNGGEWTDGRP